MEYGVDNLPMHGCSGHADYYSSRSIETHEYDNKTAECSCTNLLSVVSIFQIIFFLIYILIAYMAMHDYMSMSKNNANQHYEQKVNNDIERISKERLNGEGVLVKEFEI